MNRIAIILSGGNGTRIKSSNLPKQFIKLNNKLVLFYCLETFYKCTEIDAIVVACHPLYVDALNELIYKKGMKHKIFVVPGGKSRNKSLAKAVKYIEKEMNIRDDDIILSHDAVRIFLSEKIILDNIKLLEENKTDVVFTAIKSPDTIGFYNKNNIVFNIPNRDICFKGQTPQSAKWKVFKEVYNNNFDQNIFDNSDFCKLAEIMGKKIIVSEGSELNFKITTDYDLIVAKKLLSN